ncbi:hypothetical protein ACFYZ4_18575 [Streptomyces sp. NPDC001513]|uniref:hypothetical protein n=1 Tax=Streptomyces sp. NPDC001513 TaxID=3364580 RepID=UPI00367EC2C9
MQVVGQELADLAARARDEEFDAVGGGALTLPAEVRYAAVRSYVLDWALWRYQASWPMEAAWAVLPWVLSRFTPST